MAVIAFTLAVSSAPPDHVGEVQRVVDLFAHVDQVRDFALSVQRIDTREMNI